MDTDMKNIPLQHNMDVIKVECDPDLEAHAVTLDGEDLKQDVKAEPVEVAVNITTQENEVKNIISLNVMQVEEENCGLKQFS
jgi:hypothetical protein